MRLHRLVVQAFGPYAERTEIDLDALCSAGIFLVHGPTGGGKTSLLDAVCFALYADIPGPRPAGRALRSDHADPTLPPTVVLEFSVHERRIRVTRSPEHRRPKRRGDGSTPVPAQVLVQELTGGSWVATASRSDEAGLFLRELLGMGLEQFAKVVLLPQGDFAAFLRASPEERRTLLERLFDISRYLDVEQWLAQQRRDTQDVLERTRAAWRGGCARLDEVVTDLPSDLLVDWPRWSDPDPVEDLPAIRAAVTQAMAWLADFAAQSLVHADAADAAHVEAEAALNAAERIDADRSRGLAATASLRELDSAATDYDRQVAELAAADRAAELAGDLRAVHAAQAELAEARRLEEAAQAVAGPQVEPDPSATLQRVLGLDECVAAIDKATRLAAELERQRVQAAASLASATRQVSDLDAEIEQLQDRHQQLLEGLAAAREFAARAESGEAVVAAAQRLVTVRTEFEAAQARLGEAVVTHVNAVDVAQQARATLLDLRQRRLAALAAELAADLVDGADCPVCGSTEHPAPARNADPVGAVDLDTAQDTWESLAARAQEYAGQRATAEALVATRLADLAGDQRSLAELTADLTAIRQGWERDRAIAARQPRVLDELETVRAALADLEQQRLAAATALQLAQAAHQVVLDRAEAEARELARERARHTGCGCGGDGRQREHRRYRDRLVALGQARAARMDAESRALAALEALLTLCRATGFADVAALRAASLPDEQRLRRRERLAQLDRQRAGDERILSDPAVQAALAAPAPDLGAVRRVTEAARARRVSSAAQSGFAERAAGDFARLADQALELATQLAPLAHRAETIGRLADTVNGLGADNTLRMRLSAFVLAGRLERVVDLANSRLARLGDGRYRLRHSDQLAARGQRSGLGLRVHDLWTGVERDTATLSGGESFMASLALALGLADAVREEAGGLDLQTLFIDEGFGSLDEESLEQVLAILDELRDGGRAVAVVSHVPELRARIPAQLRVEKTDRGSRAQVVTRSA